MRCRINLIIIAPVKIDFLTASHDNNLEHIFYFVLSVKNLHVMIKLFKLNFMMKQHSILVPNNANTIKTALLWWRKINQIKYSNAPKIKKKLKILKLVTIV